MSRGDKFEKDGTVDGLIPTSADSDEGTENRNASKRRCAGSYETGHGSDQERHVEGKSAPDEVGCHGPDRRTDDKTGILGDRKEGYPLHAKLQLHWRLNVGDRLHPQLVPIVGGTNHDEEVAEGGLTLSINQPNPVVMNIFHWKGPMPMSMSASLRMEILAS